MGVRTRGVVRVTNNPTIFEKALNTSDAYSEDLRRMAEPAIFMHPWLNATP